MFSSNFDKTQIVATIIKRFFKQLPEPVLAFENWQKYIEIVEEKDNDARVETLHHLLANLPSANQSLLKFVLAFLIKVKMHT